MDIFTLLTKQLAGINSLGAGFIALCVIFIVTSIKMKNNIEKISIDVKNEKKHIEDNIEKNETMIVNFMKEVNESIKEERKFVYMLMNNTNKKIDNIDEKIKDHIRIIGELVGELRGKNESK